MIPKNIRALGRMKSGEMNKTERAYLQHLERLKMQGEIAWFKFEGIKLKLADKTYLTMDFAVMTKEGVIELHDTKGSKFIWTDDSKAKMKVAASEFPFVFKVVFPARGGGWVVEEI